MTGAIIVMYMLRLRLRLRLGLMNRIGWCLRKSLRGRIHCEQKMSGKKANEVEHE